MITSFWVFHFFSVSETVNELKRKLEQLKVANQKLQRNSRGSVFQGMNDEPTPIRRSGIDELNEPVYVHAQITNATTSLFQINTTLYLILTIIVWSHQRY